MGTRSVFLLHLENVESHCIHQGSRGHTHFTSKHIMESYAHLEELVVVAEPCPVWRRSPMKSTHPLGFLGIQPIALCWVLLPNWALKQERLVGATSLQCPSSGA